MHIKTIGDLACAKREILERKFKSRALEMIKAANGIDNTEIKVEYGQRKCISMSRTMPFDTLDDGYLKKILMDISNIVGLRARRKNLFAATIAITFKTKSFKAYSHQLKLNNPINNTMDIYHAVLKLYDEIPKKEEFRSIGIRLADLKCKQEEQISLFDKKESNDDLQKLIDNINGKYNNTVLMPAIFFENNSKMSDK